ncbi:serine/arginine repetitive matrix protein 3-like [Eschrichtius robustus]|uniref:serine/arginine repetitive matrix protein 3-like n=1 Tax=Eschrichtius robustus TaxID=9764 RepID=UPI0035BF9E85
MGEEGPREGRLGGGGLRRRGHGGGGKPAQGLALPEASSETTSAGAPRRQERARLGSSWGAPGALRLSSGATALSAYRHPASRRRRLSCRGTRPRWDQAHWPARRARDRGGAAAPSGGSRGFLAEDAPEAAREPELRRRRARGGREGWAGLPAAQARVRAALRARGAGRGWGRGQDRAGSREHAGGSGGLAWAGGPPGVICILSRRRGDSWRAARLLAHSRSAPAIAPPAQPRGARYLASPRAGEGGREPGREGARARPGSPSAPPPALPATTGPPRAPAYTWETWDGSGASCGTSGGRPRPGEEVGGGERRRKRRK